MAVILSCRWMVHSRRTNQAKKAGEAEVKRPSRPFIHEQGSTGTVVLPGHLLHLLHLLEGYVLPLLFATLPLLSVKPLSKRNGSMSLLMQFLLFSKIGYGPF